MGTTLNMWYGEQIVTTYANEEARDRLTHRRQSLTQFHQRFITKAQSMRSQPWHFPWHLVFLGSHAKNIIFPAERLPNLALFFYT